MICVFFCCDFVFWIFLIEVRKLELSEYGCVIGCVCSWLM